MMAEANGWVRKRDRVEKSTDKRRLEREGWLSNGPKK